MRRSTPFCEEIRKIFSAPSIDRVAFGRMCRNPIAETMFVQGNRGLARLLAVIAENARLTDDQAHADLRRLMAGGRR